MMKTSDPVDEVVNRIAQAKARITAEEVAHMRLAAHHRRQQGQSPVQSPRQSPRSQRPPGCAHFRRCYSKPENPTSNMGARAMEEQCREKAAQNGKKLVFLRNFSVSEEDIVVCNRVRRGVDPSWLRKQNARDRSLLRSRSAYESDFRENQHEVRPCQPATGNSPSSNTSHLKVTGLTLAEDSPFQPASGNLPGALDMVLVSPQSPHSPQQRSFAGPIAFEASLSPRLTAREQAMHGRYLIRESFANGSYGKVCAGEDVPSHQEVAVKIIPKYVLISPEEKQSVLREKLIHQTLHHPGIIKLIDVFEDENAHYFILERAANGSLSACIGSKGLDEDRCRHIFRQVLQALEYLHRHHVVHHDIKPHNVLLHHGDTIKLCDFGASRALDGVDCTLPFSGIFGTPGYIAPELLLGEHEYGSSIDVFSAGIVLFEMLLGYAPFYPPSSCTYLPVEFPRGCEISAEAKDLIQRMLCKDPHERISVAKALEHPWLQVDVDMKSNDSTSKCAVSPASSPRSVGSESLRSAV